MTVEYGSLLKPAPVVCAETGCGLADCQAVGPPTGNGHPRGCTNRCPQCRGRRNKRKGQRTQARAVRGLAIPRSSLSPGHEEFLQGPVRVECKSGAKANVVATAYRNSRTQSDAAKAIGDARAFVAAFSPDGDSRDLYVIRSDELEAAVYALAEAFGYGETG